MSETSARLSLPYLAPGQAQKHVTHNEALSLLDVIVQLVVQDFAALTPPNAPTAGQVWALGASPTGVWAGQGNRLAAFVDGAWMFVVPGTGWRAWGVSTSDIRVWQGNSWVPGGAPTTLQNMQFLGVRTTADTTNRLAVQADATLLSHDGGGHQVKVNKAGAGQTAALLFQSGFSGRAEIGLLGDNDLTVKVSNDGVTYAEALVARRTTGHVRLPQGVLADGFTLRDPADPTRAGAFSAAGIDAATTRSYTLPNLSGTLAILEGAQVFSGTMTVSAAQATIGTATGTATYGLGTGATVTGQTKTVNLGTGGAAGSTSVVNIGAGAGGQTVISSPTVDLAATVTAVNAPQANISALRAGLGGATADATNRLSVNAPATLLNHAGASHEVTVNKAAPANDAALAFKTGFSARALVGLLADDNLAIRTSPNGSTFTTALTADATTGRVSLPQGAALPGAAADPASPQNGWLWHNTTSGLIRARTGGATRSLSGLEVPFLVPPAGEHVMTTMGSGSNLSTQAGAAGRMEIHCFAPRADLVMDAVSVNVTTLVAAALAKVVVYGSDANGRPDARLAETADIDCGIAGVRTATLSLTLTAGLTYWVGIRHSSTATLSAWLAGAVPDINGGAPSVNARKALRRTLTYATAAPANWAYVSSEGVNINPTAIWLRLA